jgi:hypothetical protein
VLVPVIQGDAIELHASVVIFALIMGGSIAGLLGAILSLPIAAAGKEIYRYLFRRLTPDEDEPDARLTRPLAPEAPDATLVDEVRIAPERTGEGGDAGAPASRVALSTAEPLGEPARTGVVRDAAAPSVTDAPTGS